MIKSIAISLQISVHSIRSVITSMYRWYTMNTRGASKGKLFLPSYHSTKYGRKSLKIQSILSWNHLVSLYPERMFKDMPKNELKRLIKKHFINMYVEIA